MIAKPFAMLVLACIAAAIFSGCTNNILIRKNGEHYFLTAKQKGLKRLLCDSGDIDAILKDSILEKTQQEQLYSNICAETYNREKTLEVLNGMTKEQRENLKASFEQHGYDVNNLC